MNDKPKLAVLFWFYKEVDVCVNRLKLIRKYNPDLKVHGLYGGPIENSDEYKSKLSKYLDSFYVSPFTDPDWKWIHGDLLILDWYKENGSKFDFDSIVVFQWDMLIFDSLRNQFSALKKDQMYLSGLVDLDHHTEINWEWTNPKLKYRKDFLAFKKYIKDNYSYNKRIRCCLFVLEVLPRIFLDKYLTVKDKEIGFLEYKIPVYADIFNIDVITREKEAHWWEEDVHDFPLNAEPVELIRENIENELKKKNGWRIFHPYFKIW